MSLQYGVGNSANFSTGVEYPTVYLQNAHTFRFTDSAVIQPKNKFAVQSVFIYRSQTDGDPANGTNTWISFGARPVWFFPEHVSLTFEAGFDHTSSGLGLYDGWLRKFTIAPHIGGRQKILQPLGVCDLRELVAGTPGLRRVLPSRTGPPAGTLACRERRVVVRRWSPS